MGTKVKCNDIKLNGDKCSMEAMINGKCTRHWVMRNCNYKNEKNHKVKKGKRRRIMMNSYFYDLVRERE